MKNLFLALAILGTIVPYVFFTGYFAENGLYLVDFIAAIFVNGAAGGFTADLLISSFAFWLYLFSQKARRIPLYIILNLTVGLSLSLPLYFYFTLKDQEAQGA